MLHVSFSFFSTTLIDAFVPVSLRRNFLRLFPSPLLFLLLHSPTILDLFPYYFISLLFSLSTLYRYSLRLFPFSSTFLFVTYSNPHPFRCAISHFYSSFFLVFFLSPFSFFSFFSFCCIFFILFSSMSVLYQSSSWWLTCFLILFLQYFYLFFSLMQDLRLVAFPRINCSSYFPSVKGQSHDNLEFLVPKKTGGLQLIFQIPHSIL